jgi:hypothetical protein
MSKERNITFNFNFNAPVGQNIAHVDKIEAHFDKDMTMQIVDTKSTIESGSEEKSLEQPNEGQESDLRKRVIPESVKACFRIANDYVREQVEAIVNDFYLGQSVNLAMIEVTLFDHGQLQKRNSHKLFVQALIDWDILPKETDIDKTSIAMASKLRSSFPKKGYKEWDNIHLNERILCVKIGKKLPESMKYNRNL